MTIQQFKDTLSKGFYVIVKDKYGDFVLFSPMKDKNGNYHYFGWDRISDNPIKLENTIESIGSSYGYSDEDLEERLPKWEIIEVTMFPQGVYKRHEIGDKVKIAPNAKELCEWNGLAWNKDIEEMIGKVCNIKDCDCSDYEVWDEDETEYWYFPHSALIPFYEETQKTLKEYTMDEIAKALGKPVSEIRIKKE